MIPKEKCFTIQIGDSVQKVLEILEMKQVDALPVLDGQNYVGIVTRFHVYRAFYDLDMNKESFLEERIVSDIIKKRETVLQLEDVFEKALIALNDFPIAAVTEGDKFLGIVTRYDVLHQFKSAFGMDRAGVRITFSSVESDGRIAKLSDIIQKYHESVISLVTFDETDKLIRRIVLKIEKRDNLQKFLNELDDSGFRVLHIAED
ncbi:HPP family protein [Chungangia koreensis]|uniref:HPP family protein n=1 Tax=Chungangia koreensis TaxID=752657 RepID=A0ABV8X6E6_9LACT